MSWRYSDFIHINQDFIDVFSEEQDSQNADAWMSFIPHDQMHDVLRALLDTLERKSPQSLWMHGQYGTGKTMCLFVLKHLLEDPWPTVERYLQVHDFGADLRQRIRGIRERGRGLVVYLSGASHVDNNLKLMATLERTIRRGLERHGYQTSAGPLYDSVLETLTGAAINWPALFGQHRKEFHGLANSAQEVIDQLRAGDVTLPARVELLSKVVACLESANVVTLPSADLLKGWLDEVIAVNQLKWLVVMWDEFSEFFARNATYDGLQELAQFAGRSSFYLLLATHRAPDVIRSSHQEDVRKLSDRFHRVPYMMEPVTTNRLMAAVMQTKPERRDEWHQRRDNLWGRARGRLAGLLEANSDQRLADYAQLVPLHPYAAFLLSTISQQYSSANRTVFRFMKDHDAHALPAFLARQPEDGQDWYTADGLWDYFFREYDPDLPDRFRDTISYAQSRQGQIDDPEQLRAFKATMLLISLEREAVGAERIMPTLANLGMIYAGTSLHDKLPQIMEALCEADLLYRVGTATGERAHYSIPHANIDYEQLKRIRQQLPGFAALVKRDGALGIATRGAIMGGLAERLKRRLALGAVAYEDVKARRERVAPDAKPYEIPVVFVLSETDDQAQAARALVARLAEQEPQILWVVVDQAFGAVAFQQHQEDAAMARYYQANKDERNARYFDDRCRGTIVAWLQVLRHAPMTSWFGGEQSSLLGVEGFVKELVRSAEHRFPYGPERIITTDPLYKDSGFGVAGAQVGLGGRAKAAPYDQVLSEIVTISPDSGPLDPARLSHYPDHPVAHMKAAVDELLARDSADMDEIWALLQAPPFGLSPTPVAIVLFGLLLRECSSGFYISDGANSFALDLTRLAQLIKETMDGKGGKTLQRSSREERRFCELVRDIYLLDAHATTYLQPTCHALRGHLKQRGYPLWALQHYLDLKGRNPSQSIEMLGALITRDGDALAAYATQERLRDVASALASDRTVLRGLDDVSCYQQGMEHFLTQVDARVGTVLKSVGLTIRDLMGRLYLLLQEELYLWTEQEIQQRLPALLDELSLVGALAALTQRPVKDLEGAAAALRAAMAPGKLPLWVFAHQDGEALENVMASLAALLASGAPADPAALATAINAQAEAIRAALAQPARALRAWAQSDMQGPLSETEAEQLWAGLPDLSSAQRADEVRLAVRQHLRDMERVRAIAGLRQAWQGLTATRSPDDWGNRHQVPLGWLLESPTQAQMLAVLQRPQSATLQALQEAQKELERQAPALQALDQAEADARFAEAVGGAYRAFLSEPEDLASLREHLAQELGAQPCRWQRGDAGRATHTWLKARYRTAYLPRVVQRLATLSEARAKALLQEMAADPLVGVRLLSMDEENEH
ncbi:MAG: hypothetical protein ACOX3S_04955 [Anaerolineae bacterium]